MIETLSIQLENNRYGIRIKAITALLESHTPVRTSTINMNLLIGLFLLFLSGTSARVNLINGSEIELHGDYLRDEFLLSASRIPNVPNLSVCERQLLYISKNWKKPNVFPCKYSFIPNT